MSFEFASSTSELFVTNVKLSVSKHDVGLSFRCWPARECTMAPNFTKHLRKLLLTIFSCQFFSGGMVLFFSISVPVSLYVHANMF